MNTKQEQAMIVEKNGKQTTQSELVETLATNLTGPELDDLFQDALRRKAQQLSPPNVLSAYRTNRLVKPAIVDVMGLRALEDQLLAVLNAFDYTPLELSPVVPVGSGSALAADGQDRPLSAVCQTELVSDAATALALYVADQRTDTTTPTDRLRCSTIHRPIQQIPESNTLGAEPHRKVACFVTAGQSSDQYQFEKETFAEHLTMLALYLRDILLIDDLTFRLYSHKGYRHPGAFVRQLSDFLSQQQADVRAQVMRRRGKPDVAYRGLSYEVVVTLNDRPTSLGSGGFVDWTQQLLQTKKERLMITQINIELLRSLIKGAADPE